MGLENLTSNKAATPCLVEAVKPENQRTEAEFRVQRIFKLAQHHRRQGNKMALVNVADLEALIITAAVRLTMAEGAAP